MFAKWTVANLEKNSADPGVLNYPTTSLLCAYDVDGPLMFLPVQQPMMMESVAPRPGADPLQTAVALRELMKAVVMQAHLKGVGEIYFVSDEATIQPFAEKHAFKKMPYSLYRVKLSDLEKES
jgi:hypothetical protein